MDMRFSSAVGRVLPRGVRGRLYFLITLTLLPVMLLVFSMNKDRYASRLEQSLDTELEVAVGIGAVFESFLSNVRTENFVLGQAALQLGPAAGERITELLRKTIPPYEAVMSLNWLASDGRVVASTDSRAVGLNLSGTPYFTSIVSGEPWVVSDLVPAGILLDVPMFTVSTAIRAEDGKLLGAVTAAIEPGRLGPVIMNEERPAEGAYSVFDPEGRLVFRNPALSLTWEEREKWYESDTVLADALSSGAPRTGISFIGGLGSEWFLARVPVPGTGWIVGAGRPSAIALGSVREYLFRSIAVTALTAGAAFFLSWLVSLSISIPLRQLSAAVSGPDADGILNLKLPLAPEEVGDLRERFAVSASALKAFTDMLEKRVHERTAQLEMINRELEAFSYSVSHDLRAPLRGVDGFSKLLLEKHADRLDERGVDYLKRIRAAAQRMGKLIDDLLGLSRIGRREMHLETVDISSLSLNVVEELREREPSRVVDVTIAPSLRACGDEELMRIVLDNLIGNAWKFTGKAERPRIEIGEKDGSSERIFFVRDNGAGFEMEYAGQLFAPFQRLHTEDEFPGTGIGLATVGRIIARHGGRVWAEGSPGKGAVVYFTLPGAS